MFKCLSYFILLISSKSFISSQILKDDALQGVQEETNVSLNSQDNEGISNTTLADTRRNVMETWNIRFSKFSGGAPGFKPLVAEQYPVYGEVYDTLYDQTDATNVIMVNDEKVKDFHIPRLVKKLGGWPSYPEENEDGEFWDLLREIIDVRETRERRPNTKLFPRADLWHDYDLNACAEAVHNEQPGSIPKDFFNELLRGRWGYVYFDQDVFPQSCDESIPTSYFEKQIDKINKWTLETIMPLVFSAKWYAGRPRPEEVVWAIKRGRISKGVPTDIKQYVKSLDIQSAPEFTAYEEGSPTHPSWPAMHAASGSSSLWMAVMMDLNDQQLCQARLTDYAIAYSRTVASVHYSDDNIIGLNFAQEIIGHLLPKYLEETHNADPEIIAQKVRKYKFDWNYFDPEDPCPFLRRDHGVCYD